MCPTFFHEVESIPQSEISRESCSVLAFMGLQQLSANGRTATRAIDRRSLERTPTAYASRMVMRVRTHRPIRTLGHSSHLGGLMRILTLPRDPPEHTRHHPTSRTGL